MRPKKQNYDILTTRLGVDTITTVVGYSIGERCGVEWFVHKADGTWHVSEVRSGMATTTCLYTQHEDGQANKRVRTIADALHHAPKLIANTYARVGADRFYAAINRARDKMSAVRRAIAAQGETK